MNIFQEMKNFVGGGGTPLAEISREEEQSPDEKKLSAYIKEKLEQCRTANQRIALEGTYLTNVAYLLGYNGVYFDNSNRQFRNIDPRRKSGRSRASVNKILPTVQNRLSRLTKSPPKWDVRPNSNDSSDKDAARLGVQVIEHVLNCQRFPEKRQDLLMSAMQGGHSYIQPVWDPTLGNPIISPETGQMEGYEGDIRLEVLNCLEVFVDPLAKRLEDAQYILKAKVRKLDYFREQYPERGHAVKEEDAWLLSSIYDLKANSLMGSGTSGGSASQNQVNNSAIEIVYYEKRSKEHPNGRRVVCASGIILSDGELAVGEFDIVKFDDILIGGRYNSEAIITHLRPIQDQYTVLRTKCADWIKKTLGGKYIAPKGSGLSQEAINNDSGEVVEYTPVPNGSEPKAMSIPQIPGYVYNDIDTLNKEFDFISGINEVSRGTLPSASIPAKGMEFLQEQDETRIGVQTARNEEAYAKLAQLILKYVSKYYVLPRKLKLAGDGLGYAVKEFTGKDLNENYDVIVIAGSTAPSNKVLKRQDIMNAWQAGLLGDPADPKLRQKVLKMVEFGDSSEMWKTQALEEGRIKKAIALLESEEKPPYHELDNHAMYIQELNDYRLSEKYEMLSDKARQYFDMFLEMHIQGAVKLANPRIAQDMMMADQMMQNLNDPNLQMGPEVTDAQVEMTKPPMEPPPIEGQ